MQGARERRSQSSIAWRVEREHGPDGGQECLLGIFTEAALSRSCLCFPSDMISGVVRTYHSAIRYEAYRVVLRRIARNTMVCCL